MVISVVVVVVLLVLASVALVAFNRLRSADVGAQEALGGIDVQLTRRSDLIPNLVTTVKGYAVHEKVVLAQVTDARAGVSRAMSSGTVEQKAEADGQLGRAVFDVMAVAENYPDLEASANFLDLQRQLADTESQLAFARQYYNDSVATLNKLVVTFPWLMAVGFAKVESRPFYRAPAGQRGAPTVSF